MAGYVRVDTSNNIADGNVISASDLDNEFDGVQSAFNATTGHTHGGATGEGAPITKVGPTQDVTISASAVLPKTSATVDIGSSSLKFKDLNLSGVAKIDGAVTASSLTASKAVFTNGTKELVSNEITGTGNVVMSTSPTLVTPALGTPSSVTLTNATGLPLTTGVTGTLPVANGGTGVTTSTGSGNNVLSTSPTLVTPVLGTPTSGTMTNVTGLPLTTGVTGTLPVANGGTGATTLAGASIATYTGTETLTNKRINSRVSTAASTATLTPDISAFDQYNLTAQAAALSVAAPTGTPVDGNKLTLRILDNGTARAITWNATYTPIGFTLPTTTVVNKMIYVGCIYNLTNTRWDVVALSVQA